jgi:hypothetical protein
MTLTHLRYDVGFQAGSAFVPVVVIRRTSDPSAFIREI